MTARSAPLASSQAAIDVEQVAEVVLGCANVMGLGNEIATIHAGRRVAGVRMRGSALQLHVLGRYDVPVEDLCAEIGAVVQPLTPGMRIEVAVVDLVDPDNILGWL